jgi:LysR family hydrogen peroxide-inducible transcriptional activator
MAVPIETRSAEVSVTQLPAPRPKRTVGIVWRKSSPLSAQFGQIADLLRP